MLLAVDVGNTNIVFALFDGSEIRGRWRIASDPRRTGDEYATWLTQLLAMEGIERSAIKRIIYSSVVPRAEHNLSVLAKKYFDIDPLFAGQGEVAWDFEIDVEQPHTLGADRALNCIAAHELVGGDMIVVDFGTATKFEAIDYNGAYKGGIIAPGINLSLDALVGKTAKLPRIAIRAPKGSSVIGRNTEEQMLIGVFWGYVAMMEGLIDRMKAQIGRPVKVVATGGLAILFDEKTDIFDVIDADLTIRGLQILADRAGTQ
ncbi:pantothenate kinase [Aurantiacibacter atlanticus]|uniref:Type III pantothenate kinase n=1 Tax=Aurantiacibacter atlanticus TaxID=1648404 RepID=A0A0H4VGL0_9SPHN|nr:type III pantothenate kinase [Aurantiacibacter atlanticus]AKQ42214.1 pantothenate kinase [Aurantiacibacter atlanticus]MDF1833633.1 type III pantothenate kinase [Alteraurantiacibacter sp. bin_em_oilr2.035]